MVSHVLFVTITQKLKFVLLILCLYIKTLTLNNVIIHINSALPKDQNHYYHNTFLQKCSYQLEFFKYYNDVEVCPDKSSKKNLMVQKNLIFGMLMLII